MPKYPEIGDQVWFYFMHPFTDMKLQDNLWRATGKFEMRCRPARVARWAPFCFRTHPVLTVEFNDEDREFRTLYGGTATRWPSCEVVADPHFDATNLVPNDGLDRIGVIIDGRWPAHGTWAWDPMPGFDGRVR